MPHDVALIATEELVDRFPLFNGLTPEQRSPRVAFYPAHGAAG